MKLLDTSVAIDHLRGTRPAVELLRRLVSGEEPVVSSEVVRFELLAGVRDNEIDALEQFFSAFTWVPVDQAISRVAGDLARRHRRAYSEIDDADYLIAATALELEADLLTMNVGHFPCLTVCGRPTDPTNGRRATRAYVPAQLSRPRRGPRTRTQRRPPSWRRGPPSSP